MESIRLLIQGEEGIQLNKRCQQDISYVFIKTDLPDYSPKCPRRHNVKFYNSFTSNKSESCIVETQAVPWPGWFRTGEGRVCSSPARCEGFGSHAAHRLNTGEQGERRDGTSRAPLPAPRRPPELETHPDNQHPRSIWLILCNNHGC